MNRTTPQIAVVIPAYNASAYIQDAVSSVFAQTRPADEVVVVDDGSTDDTAARAAGAGATVLRQRNAGPASARQNGFEHTTAEFLLFLDADDMLHPSTLEKLSAALSNNPQAGLACCPAEIWSPGNGNQTCLDTLPKPGGNNLWEQLVWGNFIRTSGCVLIRRQAVLEVGGWQLMPDLIGNEDWDLWLRLAEQHSFVMVDEPLLKYRAHNTSLSGNSRRMTLSMFALFKYQRLRWANSPGHLRTISASEWQKSKYHCRIALRKSRQELRKGRIGSALNLGFDSLLAGSLPALNRITCLLAGIVPTLRRRARKLNQSSSDLKAPSPG